MMQSSSSTTRHPGTIYLCFVLLAVFVLYAIAWIATVVAGGHPKGVPLNPGTWGDSAARALDGRHRHIWEWLGATSVNTGVFYGLLWAVGVVVVIAVVVLAAAIAGRAPGTGFFVRSWRPDRKRRGWGRGGELSELFVRRPTVGRIILGRIGSRMVATLVEMSLLLIGPTRQGKTTDFIIPAVLEHDGPVVVTSTKNDIPLYTAAFRQRKGKVFIYDPTGATELHDTNWTPLAGCKGNARHSYRVAKWMAEGLKKSDTAGAGGGDADWSHWADKAARLAGAAFFAAATLDWPISVVREWIDISAEKEIAIAIKTIAEQNLAPMDEIKVAVQNLMAIKKCPEKEKGSVYSTTGRLFEVFIHAAAEAASVTNDLDPKEFLSGANILYLVAPSHDQKDVAVMFTGIIHTILHEAYSQAVKSRRGRIEPQLLLALDEAANVAPIRSLPEVASQGLSQGIILISVFQDMAQMEQVYGRTGARTILNNHTAKVVLPGLGDPDTAKTVCELAGGEVSVEKTRSDSGSNTYTERDRALLTPDQLRQVPRGKALVIMGGKRPFYVSQRSWWSDPVLALWTMRLNWHRGARHVDDPAGLAPHRLPLFERLLNLLNPGRPQRHVMRARPMLSYDLEPHLSDLDEPAREAAA
ncbi:MAG: type IV secretory system conjugative DNA transfer family protein [Candidatus Dormibacteria bacterium]